MRFAPLFALLSAVAVSLLLASGGAAAGGVGSTASGASRTCKIVLPLCTDPGEPINDLAGGPYVGHDEPSLLFYDHRPGSGNDVTYDIRLPKDPPTMPTQDSAQSAAGASSRIVGMTYARVPSGGCQVAGTPRRR